MGARKAQTEKAKTPCEDRISFSLLNQQLGRVSDSPKETMETK